MFGHFLVLARVIRRVFRNLQAHLFSGLNEIVAQVAIAAFGHPAFFGFEIARIATGPPQPRNLGHRILRVAQILGTKALVVFVPFDAGEKTGPMPGIVASLAIAGWNST
jgi:hypothetical protein